MPLISGNLLGTAIPQARGTSAVAGVSVLGWASLMAKLKGLPAVAKLAVGSAMKKEMEDIIQLAKDKFVPVETEKLKKSGRTRGPIFVKGGVVEVWGSFGPVRNPRGSNYAVPVHEIPAPPSQSVGGRSARHQFGSWKYLQIPFLLRQNGMANRIGSNTLRLMAFLRKP